MRVIDYPTTNKIGRARERELVIVIADFQPHKPGEVRGCSKSPGPGCTTTSQTHPPSRLHLLGANWPPWHLTLKLSLPQKVGCTAEAVTQSGTSVPLG